MENAKKIWIVIWILLVFIGVVRAQQEIPDKIKSKIVAGISALENAKKPADMDLAVKEFSEAALIAPEYPDVHFYLGKTLSMMQGMQAKLLQN